MSKSWSWKKVGEGQSRQKHRGILNAVSLQKYKQFISQDVLGELKLKGKNKCHMRKGVVWHPEVFYPRGSGKPMDSFMWKRAVTGSEF